MREHDRPPHERADVSRIVDALADAKRRHVLYYLRERESASLSNLATVVTGWLNARADDGVATPEQRHRIKTALHHTHLPKLEEAGLVTYDAATETVALEPLPDPAAEYLDLTLTNEDVPTDDWNGQVERHSTQT